MRIAADLHTHTLVSGHAYSTIEENCRAAAAIGLDGLAITDHGPNMPTALPAWYFNNMVVLPDVIHGVRVFRGMEANILDDTGAIDGDWRMTRNLDLIVASCHTVCIKGPDADYYTTACVRAMDDERISIIGHPDDGRMPMVYPQLVKAAADTGTLLELNNHSLSDKKPREGAQQNCRELLKECRRQGVMIVVNTDAHFSASVGHFEYALALVEEMNFPEELIANTSLEKFMACLAVKRKK